MAGPRVPLSTLRLRPRGRRRMTRGRDDWLGLSRTTLAFATLRRFSTAHRPSAEVHLEGGVTARDDFPGGTDDPGRLRYVRKRPGVTPTNRLKCREKLLWSEN